MVCFFSAQTSETAPGIIFFDHRCHLSEIIEVLLQVWFGVSLVSHEHFAINGVTLEGSSEGDIKRNEKYAGEKKASHESEQVRNHWCVHDCDIESRWTILLSDTVGIDEYSSQDGDSTFGRKQNEFHEVHDAVTFFLVSNFSQKEPFLRSKMIIVTPHACVEERIFADKF